MTVLKHQNQLLRRVAQLGVASQGHLGLRVYSRVAHRTAVGLLALGQKGLRSFSLDEKSMKRVGIALSCMLLFGSGAHAQLVVNGSGSSRSIDASGFPPGMQAAYRLMTQKCTRCHTIERIIESLQTGITPISRTAFNKQTSESVVVRMYLKPDSHLSKSDARAVLGLLNFLIDENERSVAEKR